MNDKNKEIPQYVIDGIARLLMPEIQKFYESPEDKMHLPEQEKISDDSAIING